MNRMNEQPDENRTGKDILFSTSVEEAVDLIPILKLHDPLMAKAHVKFSSIIIWENPSFVFIVIRCKSLS